jgi:UDPglucose 6-dehydrogenase
VNIGFVGLGKLGLPVALCLADHGHEVTGYDTSTKVVRSILARNIPYREEGAQDLLDRTTLKLAEPREIVATSDLVFVAVQTPHSPEFEGVTPLPDERQDFDYTALRSAVEALAVEAAFQQKPTTIVVISTVLPGTMRREVKPLLNRWTSLVYNPFFIAMGTTVNDFLHPEFVLVGADQHDPQDLISLYSSLHGRPVYVTDITTAELTKVAYNTFIGMKIVFANAVMELSHRVGANADHVTDALALATDRIISPRYMRGGMGDGGGCHPRDNIALSWLARELGLSHDIFTDLMAAREHQTGWLADLIQQEQEAAGLPVVLLGKAYKPETNLTVGSPALLLAQLLADRGVEFTHTDPYA